MDAPEPKIIPYCTNVHPAESVEEIVRALRTHALPLKRRFDSSEEFPLGLRLGERAVSELSEGAAAREELEGFLRDEGFFCTTLNVFPQGEFHARRVKEQVYLPDWRHAERVSYTLRAARVLARMLPFGEERGTLSTVPLGFRSAVEADLDSCRAHLLRTVRELAHLEDESGAQILLCLEPEPCCQLETIPEFLAFYEEFLAFAAEAPEAERVDEGLIRRHLGICYDTCHQAVEFGEPSYELECLERAGITVGKIQLSSALEIQRPGENPDGLQRLAEFVEPRFLHQVVARRHDQTLERFLDLPEYLERQEATPSEFETARCHFHVPIHLSDAWPLRTTQPQLCEVLNRMHHRGGDTQLEIETYTFDVLPQDLASPLVDDLESEIRFAMNGIAHGFDGEAHA